MNQTRPSEQPSSRNEDASAKPVEEHADGNDICNHDCDGTGMGASQAQLYGDREGSAKASSKRQRSARRAKETQPQAVKP